MISFALAWLLLAMPVAPGAAGDAQFHWLNPGSDSKTYQAVSKLLPTGEFDQIREIGLVGNEALVFASKRDPGVAYLFGSPNYDYFLAYDVSLASNVIRKIWSGYGLTFTGDFRIRMSPGKTGDFFINYQTCSECEPTTMLASFFVDSDSHWQVRKWDEKYAGFVVSYFGPEDESTTTVYMVKDFDHDGYDDIYVWSLYEDGIPKDRREYFESFSVKNGAPVRTEVTGSNEIRRFKEIVCKAKGALLRLGQESEKCRLVLHGRGVRKPTTN